MTCNHKTDTCECPFEKVSGNWYAVTNEKLYSINCVANIAGTEKHVFKLMMEADGFIEKRALDGKYVPAGHLIESGYMTTKMHWGEDGIYRPVCKVTARGVDFLLGWYVGVKRTQMRLEG